LRVAGAESPDVIRARYFAPNEIMGVVNHTHLIRF
jgi:hypothetical protein